MMGEGRKEEDLGITGGRCSGNTAVFLKELMKSRGNSQNRYSIELISAHRAFY